MVNSGQHYGLLKRTAMVAWRLHLHFKAISQLKRCLLVYRAVCFSFIHGWPSVGCRHKLRAQSCAVEVPIFSDVVVSRDLKCRMANEQMAADSSNWAQPMQTFRWRFEYVTAATKVLCCWAPSTLSDYTVPVCITQPLSLFETVLPTLANASTRPAFWSTGSLGS